MILVYNIIGKMSEAYSTGRGCVSYGKIYEFGAIIYVDHILIEYGNIAPILDSD